MDPRKFLPFHTFAILISFALIYSTSAQLQDIQREGFGSVLTQSGKEFSRQKTSNAEIQWRLPTVFIPFTYRIEIQVLLNDTSPDWGKAPGQVDILVRCVQGENRITLHATDMLISTSDVTVYDEGGEPIPLRTTFFEPEFEFFHIDTLNNLIPNRNYTISIKYEARVAEDRIVGLYLTKYNTPSGELKYAAATQLQAVDARRVFPCFDEPEMKASFEVKIGRLPGFHSLSNMNLRGSSGDENGVVWDSYYMTSPMSTYLVAFFVSEFTSVSAPPGLYDKPVQVWGPRHLIEAGEGDFAAESSAKSLAFFDEYTRIPYGFPKMDSVYVPQFPFGAMENWGLNTYMPGFIFYTHGQTTQFQKFFISNIMAHELAHQWWGNLVTMRWWNHIWLNEGLTTYFMFFGANASQPQFDPFGRMVFDTFQLAMRYDCRPDAVAMSNNITDAPVQFPRDVIYEKGASLLRMLQGFLGPNTLRNGLSNYLQALSYDNAVQDQLYDHLTQQAHQDGMLPRDVTVGQIMDNWTNKPGVPLVRIFRAGQNRILVSQERYFQVSLLVDKPISSQTWTIPVPYITASDAQLVHTPKFWLNETSTATHVLQRDTNEWILVNPEAMGYYRVLYDTHFTNLLIEQLERNHAIIPSASRSQLLDDYVKSSEAAYITIDTALSLTTYMNSELHMAPWLALTSGLTDTFMRIHDNSTVFNPFKTYFLGKLQPVLETIGFQPVETEEPPVAMTREAVLRWACAMSSSRCLETAQIYFNQWMANQTHNPMPADVQPMMYCAAASDSSMLYFNFLLNMYQQNRTVYARQDTLIINALACANGSTWVDVLYDMAISPTSELKSREHRIALLKALTENNPYGRSILLTKLRNNIEDVIESTGMNGIQEAIRALSKYSSTTQRWQEIQNFVTAHDEKLDANTVRHIYESMDIVNHNVKWAQLNFDRLTTWLQKQI